MRLRCIFGFHKWKQGKYIRWCRLCLRAQATKHIDDRQGANHDE